MIVDDPPLRRSIEAVDQIQQRCFSATVRSDKPYHLSALDGKIHAVDNGRLACMPMNVFEL